MDNEKYFWEMWNMKGKSTLIIFNRMLESKKFEHMSLMSWKYNKSGYHLISIYKRYKKYVLTNEMQMDNANQQNKTEISVSKEVEDFVMRLKKEHPEMVEWLNSLGEDESN